MVRRRWGLWGCWALVAVAFIALGQPSARADEARNNARYAAIVIDATSGRVLYAARADSQRFPASLTKMMTLYELFEAIKAGQLSLDDKMTVSRRAANQPPSKLGLAPGAKIRVEDAIEALVVRSANDIAVVVAEALGGSETAFAKRMTQEARALGMDRTTYRNASGLPHREQVTTARDLAILGQALVRDFPEFYHYFDDESFRWAGRNFETHNRLIKKMPGVDGIKTGYTRASGFNLVTSAERSGHRLIGVVLGGRTAGGRDEHMRALLNTQFAALLKGGPAQPPAVAETPEEPLVSENDTPLVPRPKPGSERIVLADATVPASAPVSPLPALTPAPGPSAVDVVPFPEAPSGDAGAASPASPLSPGPYAFAALEPAVAANMLAPRPNPMRAAPILAAASPAPASLGAVPYAPSAATGAPSDAVGASSPAASDSSFAFRAGAPYGIQIGAYVSEESAVMRLEAAREAVPDLLSEVPESVALIKVEDTTFYRARFGPFDGAAAERACDALIPHGFKCFKVPLDGPDATAAITPAAGGPHVPVSGSGPGTTSSE